ncbi:R-spondin-2-like [Diadema antillarum]|uniref:R-spondin-2-like n=1 Tax=Diadema antillarum TaxID=105358 RepID=UPI003A850518
MLPEGFIFAVTLLLGLIASLEGRHRGKGCPLGCSSCSTFNGCLTCKPRFHFLLHRSGMKQIGLCTHTCPVDFYANSAGGYSRCSRCRIDNCETCVSRNFCARCRPPFVGVYGKCMLQCPEDMYADERTGRCEVKVDCEVTSWSPWGQCAKKGQTCGHKWGKRQRQREVVVSATPGGQPCPELVESERCRMSQRYCPGKKPRRSKNGKKNKEKEKGQRENGKADRESKKSQRTDRERSAKKERRREKKKKEAFVLETPLHLDRTI